MVTNWAPPTPAATGQSRSEPVCLSDGESDDARRPATSDADHVDQVLRLQFWIYNAMKTLEGHGAEGRAILQKDELAIWGPGRVGVRPDTFVIVDPFNVEYLREKLAYFEAKCQPLSQTRRRQQRSWRNAKEQRDGRGGNGNANANGGTASSKASAVTHIHGAFPASVANDPHAKKNYYYNTLRQFLYSTGLQRPKVDDFVRRYGNGGASDAKVGRFVIADTAAMPLIRRTEHLLDQAEYLTEMLQKLYSRLTPDEFKDKVLRRFDLEGFASPNKPPIVAFYSWMPNMTQPNAAAQCWYVPYGLVSEHGIISHQLLDYVEANQGLAFRAWLHAGPDMIADIVQLRETDDMIYTCRLLAAALLSPERALAELVRRGRNNRPTKFLLGHMGNNMHSWHWQRGPRIWRWLDGIPGPEPPLDQFEAKRARRMARAAEVAQLPGGEEDAPPGGEVDEPSSSPSSPARPPSSGSSVSLMEISADEFARAQLSRGRKQKRQLQQGKPQPKLRGGHGDSDDDDGDGGDDDDDDDDDDGYDDDMEQPPAKRTRREEAPQHTPSVRHQRDRSMHHASTEPARGTGMATDMVTGTGTATTTATTTVTTQMTDTPMSQPVVPSVTDTPQSSATSATTAEVAKGPEMGESVAAAAAVKTETEQKEQTPEKTVE